MSTAAAVGAMECWAWPPSYPRSYRPPDGQVHWFPVRETMDPDRREELIFARIRR